MVKLRIPVTHALDLPKRYLDGTEGLRGVPFVAEPATIFSYLDRNGGGMVDDGLHPCRSRMNRAA